MEGVSLFYAFSDALHQASWASERWRSWQYHRRLGLRIRPTLPSSLAVETTLQYYNVSNEVIVWRIELFYWLFVLVVRPGYYNTAMIQNMPL